VVVKVNVPVDLIDELKGLNSQALIRSLMSPLLNLWTHVRYVSLDTH